MPDLTISTLAGILLSLVFSYIPGASTWYEKFTAQQKSLLMLLFLALACVVIFVASCLGFLTQLACTADGAKSLIPLFISAMIANQSTYQITKNI